MFGTNGLIIWLLGGAGTFLLYSAVSNQKPQDVLTKYLGSTSTTPGKISTWSDPNASASGFVAGAAIGAQALTGGALAVDPHGSVTTLPTAYQSTPNTYVDNV